MKHSIFLSTLLLTALSFLAGCSGAKSSSATTDSRDSLRDSLEAIIAEAPGQIGLAVIFDNGDTLTVNNSADYPLMSMFKLPEALATGKTLDLRGQDFDSVMTINRAHLNPDTWSPMLKDYAGDSWSMTVGDLVRYILIPSDNNASNLLFDSIVSVEETQRFITALLPDTDIKLLHTEAEMQREHEKSYDNSSSPLAYARLVEKVFTDSIISPAKQDFIRRRMLECNTGLDRISAPLLAVKGATFGHRTGSGYTNERGEVTAVNDGGYVTLPDGTAYTIVILVKDFAGPQPEAERIMASLSAAVLDHVLNHKQFQK